MDFWYGILSIVCSVLAILAYFWLHNKVCSRHHKKAVTTVYRIIEDYYATKDLRYSYRLTVPIDYDDVLPLPVAKKRWWDWSFKQFFPEKNIRRIVRCYLRRKKLEVTYGKNIYRW